MFSRKESESFWSSLETLLLKKLTADSTPEDIASLESSVSRLVLVEFDLILF